MPFLKSEHQRILTCTQSIAFGEAANIGGGLTEMPVSIMLWDAWANPVTDSTAAYFTLNPPTAAAIIAEELSLSLDDATRMMKGTEMVPCDKQLTAQYMGTTDKIGGFADTLVKTSKFLVSEKRLPVQLTRTSYERFLAPSYLENVVGK